MSPTLITSAEALQSNTQSVRKDPLRPRTPAMLGIRVPGTAEGRTWERVQDDQRTVRHVGGVWTDDTVGQWPTLRLFCNDALVRGN